MCRSSWTLFRIFFLSPLGSSILKPNLTAEEEERGEIKDGNIMLANNRNGRKVRHEGLFNPRGRERRATGRKSERLEMGEDGERANNSFEMRFVISSRCPPHSNPSIQSLSTSFFFDVIFTQVQSMFIELSKRGDAERRGDMKVQIERME